MSVEKTSISVRALKLIRPPVFNDEEQNRVARILYIILMTLLIASSVAVIININEARYLIASGFVVGDLVTLSGLWLTRRGRVKTASFLVLFMFLIIVTFTLYKGNGIHDIAAIAYPVVVLLASLLLDRRMFVVLTGLCILSVGGIVFGDVNGLIVTPFRQLSSLSDFISIAMILIIMAVSSRLLTDSLNQSLARARQNERALAEINRQLKLQAENLKASEERWRSLVENAPDLIMNVLRDGTIELTNASKAFGGSQAVAGTTIYDLIPTDQQEKARQAIDRVFETGLPADLEVRGFTPGGDAGWFSIRLSPIFQEEHIASLTLIATDITGNKQAEEKINLLNTTLEQRVIQRTGELETKNREMETFTYSVSHDLKAPLRGIDGYSRLLLEDYADRLDEDGRSFLLTIRRATDQMNQLINDLLAYSRLERRSLIKGNVHLPGLIEEVVTERKGEISDRHVLLTVNIPCEYVMAEVEGLTQALRNLLDNALKFTHQVETPCIEISGYKTEKSCVLWVKDNGIGFDMQYHDRIFEIFQRLHRAEDYPGTGIGLALVRKVMQRMGGRVWAESAPGAGAKFFLEIPW
jgi:PAS domain S-box-containing protein